MTQEMPASTDPELTLQLGGDPNEPLQAIVTSTDGLDALLAELPPEVHVDHAYTMTASVCVTARPSDLRRLIEMPMVKSIEPVKTVHHW